MEVFVAQLPSPKFTVHISSLAVYITGTEEHWNKFIFQMAFINSLQEVSGRVIFRQVKQVSRKRTFSLSRNLSKEERERDCTWPRGVALSVLPAYSRPWL